MGSARMPQYKIRSLDGIKRLAAPVLSQAPPRGMVMRRALPLREMARESMVVPRDQPVLPVLVTRPAQEASDTLSMLGTPLFGPSSSFGKMGRRGATQDWVSLGNSYVRRWWQRFVLWRHAWVNPAGPVVPRPALYVSLASGVAFGVLVTALTLSIFDQGVSANDETALKQKITEVQWSASQLAADDVEESLGASVEGSDIFLEYFSQAAEDEYHAKITEMVKGYPIESMLPHIFTKDRTVAAFLIGIAKKESNWGKRVPVLDDQDCFNYWGYRGVRRLMGTGGHTCFNSKKDAVDTVAKRIETLVYSEKLNTPEKMILWKCGFSCEGHSRESVKKWISDVNLYFSQLDQSGYE